MSVNRIKEAAFIHFARNGYEGASLAQIAEEAGIKKQSIAWSACSIHGDLNPKFAARSCPP